jgi:ATP-dependent Clp protease ATP-binding subunit ClpA
MNDCGDEFGPVEHLLVGALADVSTPCQRRHRLQRQLLKVVIQELRGGRKSRARAPEDQHQSLKPLPPRTSTSRRGKMTPRIGRDEKIRRVPQPPRRTKQPRSASSGGQNRH